MSGNLSAIGGVIGGLLVALLLLPISVGGTGSHCSGSCSDCLRLPSLQLSFLRLRIGIRSTNVGSLLRASVVRAARSIAFESLGRSIDIEMRDI
jgi:hypothetical protein